MSARGGSVTEERNSRRASQRCIPIAGYGQSTGAVSLTIPLDRPPYGWWGLSKNDSNPEKEKMMQEPVTFDRHESTENMDTSMHYEPDFTPQGPNPGWMTMASHAVPFLGSSI